MLSLMQLILLLLSLLQANAAEVCRSRDYLAVFGSNEFDINEFVVSVSPNGDHLIIGGKATFNSRRRVLESTTDSNRLEEFDLAEFATDSDQQF